VQPTNRHRFVSGGLHPPYKEMGRCRFDRRSPDIAAIAAISLSSAALATLLSPHSPLAAAHSLTVLSWPEPLDASGFRRACRMAIGRDPCPLLALCDMICSRNSGMNLFAGICKKRDSSLNSTIQELPGSGWLAAEPEATSQTHRLRPWDFPTVSPSHPSVFPHHGIQRITVEFSEKSPKNPILRLDLVSLIKDRGVAGP